MTMVLRRRLLAAVTTLAAGIAVRKPQAADRGSLKPVAPPVKPPEVAFTAPDGTEHRLSDYRGQGVVVNLWATWCAPCVAELPSLATLAKAVAPDKIAVLPVSADRGGAPAVEAFYKAHGIEGLPILLDKDGALMRAFKARGIPTTYVIDREGLERAYAEGGTDWAAPATIAQVKAVAGT